MISRENNRFHLEIINLWCDLAPKYKQQQQLMRDYEMSHEPSTINYQPWTLKHISFDRVTQSIESSNSQSNKFSSSFSKCSTQININKLQQQIPKRKTKRPNIRRLIKENGNGTFLCVSFTREFSLLLLITFPFSSFPFLVRSIGFYFSSLVLIWILFSLFLYVRSS